MEGANVGSVAKDGLPAKGAMTWGCRRNLKLSGNSQIEKCRGKEE